MTTHNKAIPKLTFWQLLKIQPRNTLDMFHALTSHNILQLPILKRYYFVNRPEFIQHILQQHVDDYPKSGHSMKIAREALGDGLLVNRGEVWWNSRKVLQPFFYERNHLSSIPAIVEMTERQLDQWPTEKVFDLTEAIMALVLQSTMQCIFNIQLSNEEAREIVAIVGYGHQFIAETNSLRLYLPTLANFKYRRCKKRLYEILANLLKKNSSEILSALAKAVPSEKKLLDEFKTLVITGHETTGSALNWVWYCLNLNPEYKTPLFEAAKAIDLNHIQLKNFGFIRRVFDESMRLYPPIWMFSERLAERTDFLDGYCIPEKSYLIMSPYVLHRHPDYWQYPDRFWPDHFLPENSLHRSKYVYLPFGLGPRICLASNFALLQGLVILTTMAKRCDILITNLKEISPQPLISLRPKPHLKAVLRKL